MNYFILRGLITAVVAITVSICYQKIKHYRKPICCRCKHIQRIGGLWKYYCEDNPTGFDKAPSFCYKFKEREK